MTAVLVLVLLSLLLLVNVASFLFQAGYVSRKEDKVFDEELADKFLKAAAEPTPIIVQSEPVVESVVFDPKAVAREEALSRVNKS